MKNRKRKGFAIVLVAALAGLVFLLGASLVAISQLQTASANYDQRVRLAREHARASLDMAIAELQQKMGKDTSVSFLADVLRTETTEDFKVAGSSSVREPFWTGARNGSETQWLVTRALDGTTESPQGTAASVPVVLYGNRTSVPSHLKVSVPREPIQVDGIDGYLGPEAIGHYAYWVGDLGTKASYALYDKTSQVLHDEYSDVVEGSFLSQRLRQLRATKPFYSIFNADDTSAVPSNPWRIDSLVNDFQFRDGFGGSDEYYLKGLTAGEVEDYFHDFTPLSEGLLVNTVDGGLRTDLSSLALTEDADYDDRYLPFAKLAKSGLSTSTSYVSASFPVQAGEVRIAPVITQFNLNYSVYLSGTAAETQTLYISFVAVVELWNPYSSEIDLGTSSLIIDVDGLPQLSSSLSSLADGLLETFNLDLSSTSKAASFEIESLGSSSNKLRPGQFALYGQPAGLAGGGAPPYPLVFGRGASPVTTDRILINAGTINLVEALTGGVLALSFADGAGAAQTANIEVKLSEMESDGDLNEIATYTVDQPFTYQGADPITDLLSIGIPRFGFGWKVKDEVLWSASTYHPLDTSLSVADLEQFDAASDYTYNRIPNFYPDETDIIDYNQDYPLDPLYDLSILGLPKQELTTVSQLTGTHEGGWLGAGVGDPGNSENDYLDRFFFSTLPDASPTWSVGDTLPNSAYIPESPSADSMFVHGMFNVNSTSIDAWAALLKSCPSDSIQHWNDTIGSDKFLFFNLPFGGEDGYAPPVEIDDDIIDILPADEQAVYIQVTHTRSSYKTNVIALSEEQVDALARFLVSKIRTYIQANGPFQSLAEFADSGVLRDAIGENYFVPVDEDDEGDVRLNPAWVVPGSPAQLRQSTILNLIGPYLSARSDTFLVRAYGDATDPADPDKIWARAYCEAVVQRVHKQFGEEIDEDAADKRELDRTFKVVAFRWLSPAEI